MQHIHTAAHMPAHSNLYEIFKFYLAPYFDSCVVMFHAIEYIFIWGEVGGKIPSTYG